MWLCDCVEKAALINLARLSPVDEFIANLNQLGVLFRLLYELLVDRSSRYFFLSQQRLQFGHFCLMSTVDACQSVVCTENRNGSIRIRSRFDIVMNYISSWAIAWDFILSYRTSCIFKLSVRVLRSCRMFSSRSFSSVATCFVRSYFLKVEMLKLSQSVNVLMTYECRSEKVVSNDVKWWAFCSLSFFKSWHFFSYDWTTCSFSAMSSEIAFS